METQKYLLQNKAEKLKKGRKNQKGQIENQQQVGRIGTTMLIITVNINDKNISLSPDKMQ